MVDKVKLTKEQADALEEAKKEFENDRIITNHISGNGGEWLRQCSALNGMTIDKLIKAVYIGYERVVRPEEQLLEAFKRLQGVLKNEGATEREKDRALAQAEGVFQTLEYLNIQIQGINGKRNS